jgi:hypothetical protein
MALKYWDNVGFISTGTSASGYNTQALIHPSRSYKWRSTAVAGATNAIVADPCIYSSNSIFINFIAVIGANKLLLNGGAKLEIWLRDLSSVWNLFYTYSTNLVESELYGEYKQDAVLFFGGSNQYRGAGIRVRKISTTNRAMEISGLFCGYTLDFDNEQIVGCSIEDIETFYYRPPQLPSPDPFSTADNSTATPTGAFVNKRILLKWEALTQTEISRFLGSYTNNLYLNKLIHPVCLWDNSGDVLTWKLEYGYISNYKVTAYNESYYNLEIEFLRIANIGSCINGI